MKPSKPSLGKQILRSIPAVMRVLRSNMRALAAGHLTIPQFRILAHLNPGSETITSLAELQGVSVPAMSKMLDGLIAKGFLKRRTCETDRRTQWIELLPKGRKIFERLESQAELKLNEQLTGLSQQEIKNLEASLVLLRSLFVERTTDGGMQIKNAL